MIGDPFKMIVDIALGLVPGTIIDISKIMTDFAYPECPNWGDE